MGRSIISENIITPISKSMTDLQFMINEHIAIPREGESVNVVNLSNLLFQYPSYHIVTCTSWSNCCDPNCSIMLRTLSMKTNIGDRTHLSYIQCPTFIARYMTVVPVPLVL